MKAVGIILLVLILALAAGSVWQRGRGTFEETTMTGNNNPSASSAAQTESQPIPRGPVAPDILSDTWFNSPTLAPADLRGKVVVVEFWTFG